MESVLQGWLIKSPPEKKSFGNLKLFGAKWRRRYFVLYAPPTVEGIPDAYTAILEYYTSKKLHHKCGSINLSECEEVMSSLDSDIYKHVFGLQTKHKNRNRTYYLVAENETVMNKWVNTLIRVLGLTENADRLNSPPSAVEVSPQALPNVVSGHRTVAARPSMARPRPNFSTHPSSNPLSPSSGGRVTTLQVPFSRLNVSEPNLLDCCDAPFGSSMSSGAGCSSVPDLDQLPLHTAGSPSRTQPERARVGSPPKPPAPRPRTSLSNVAAAQDSLTTAVGIGPGVVTTRVGEKCSAGRVGAGHPPGVKGLPRSRKVEEGCMTYDHPTQSYYAETAVEEKREYLDSLRSRSLDMVEPSGVASFCQPDFYDQPPARRFEDASRNTLSVKRSLPVGLRTVEHHIGAAEVTGAAGYNELYNVPQNQQDFHNIPQNQQDFYNIPQNQQDFYKLPQSQNELYNMPPTKLNSCANEDEEVYNTPLSKEDLYTLPLKQKARSNGLDQELYDAPNTLQAVRQSIPDLPQRSNKPKASMYADDQTCDVSAAPPPPKPVRKPACKVLHDEAFSTLAAPASRLDGERVRKEVNDTLESGRVNDGVGEDVYDTPGGAMYGGTLLSSKSSVSYKQNEAPLTSPPSYIVRKQSGVLHQDSIRFTQRSKSFKRSLSGRQPRSELPLPTKRLVEQSDSSDDDIDDDDDTRTE